MDCDIIERLNFENKKLKKYMQIKKTNQNKQPIDAQLVSYCPLCHHSFSPRQAAVIGQGGQIHLLYVNCQHCASALIVLLLVSEFGISSVGVVTDCTEGDIVRCKDTEPVSADDCLLLFELLKSGWNFI